jgi:hypothetical protein
MWRGLRVMTDPRRHAEVAFHATRALDAGVKIRPARYASAHPAPRHKVTTFLSQVEVKR